ncbi:MAG: serine/threonine protein kinase [Hyalangium sp.]|uniref:serine/threonine protein kinase n=1 Tax=Hyalangium sp. TaxID=2028555 RepID=UPI00389A9EE9
MQHPFHLTPDMMVGPFRIQARLGAGGFGAVFRVECGGELYALKFAVHGPESEDLNRTDARARRELACLLLVSHPNVVRVWAHGRWPHPRTGYHYIVMDYVEGATLSEWVKRTRPPLRQVLRLFDTLALTLDALHLQGLHHRDLKGSNILVRQRDGEPVLVDFGAGEHVAVSAPLTEGPLPPGTPHLRTPEAVRFHREQYADPHARYPFQPSDDLYALGCTLYEVLTGAPAFPPTLPREVLTSLIEKEMPPSPAVLNPRVPPAMAELVLRLLAKRPEERPESGRALHEQLQAVLRDETPTLDMPLVAGADAVTTEGMGGPAVTSSADDPERPLSGRVDWGGRLAPTSQSEASAPTVLAERASPDRSKPLRRIGLPAVALVLVAAVGLGLWRGASTPRAPGPRPEPPVATLAPPPSSTLPEPPRMARAEDASSPAEMTNPSGDAEPRALASRSAEAGPRARAELPPSPPQSKGSFMRTKPPAKNPSPRPEPEKPRSPGSSVASPLAGVVAACVLTGGCAASEPLVRSGPPPLQQCPPGAKEAIESLGLESMDSLSVLMPGAPPKHARYEDEVVATEGRHEVTVRLLKRGDDVLYGSVVVGDFFLTDRLYARFVELRLPDGRRYPWCGYLVAPKDGKKLGAPFLPDSKPGAMKIGAIQEVEISEDKH